MSVSGTKAVAIGHAWINLPILALVVAGGGLGWLLGDRWVAIICALVLIAPGWLWWSFSVPRWRRWALRRGAPPHELQLLAERTGLVWSKGFVLEKTELPLPDDDEELG